MPEKQEFTPNPLFCRECVDRIVVPDVVGDDLTAIIEEKMKKAGFYYRIAYRVKEKDSMVNKLLFKDYGRIGGENEDKKMQDLVGIRIMLYFEDDMAIVRNLLDTIFVEPGIWETTENTEYEFKAMKVNGIYRLPDYLAKSIINPDLAEYVDDTFEIQLRTNSFEGWHEIEHDLRYKGSAFGEGNEALARKMNSILATLELCDDSLVKLLEDLGHNHYKMRKWDNMIRCHYRLKFNTQPLNQKIIDIFDQDKELAKLFFKASREPAITEMWKNTSVEIPELTLDQIIRIVNQLSVHDERLYAVFAEIDSEREKRNVGKRKKFEPFTKLGTYSVFNAKTLLDTSNAKEIEVFKKATSYIYSWIKSRYSETFVDMPDEISDYVGALPGYSIFITYDEKRMNFKERTTHIDSKVANRIWISTATIKKTDEGMTFTVSNEYAEPQERYRDLENILFSRPNFYGEIADNVGIIDIERLKESFKEICMDDVDDMKALIEASDRQFPVIVFVDTEGGMLEEFDVGYFSFLVGYYAHIKVIKDQETAKRFAMDYDIDSSKVGQSITVFYKNGRRETNLREEIDAFRFEVIKFEQKKYWNERGIRAYRRQLIAQIRCDNVN